MTNHSKINGHNMFAGPKEIADEQEMNIFKANVAYINALQDVTGGNLSMMISASMSTTTMLMSSVFNGDQKRVADTFRAATGRFADLIEANAQPVASVLQ
jgi:hypothetical protein